MAVVNMSDDNKQYDMHFSSTNLDFLKLGFQLDLSEATKDDMLCVGDKENYDFTMTWLGKLKLPTDKNFKAEVFAVNIVDTTDAVNCGQFFIISIHKPLHLHQMIFNGINELQHVTTTNVIPEVTFDDVKPYLIFDEIIEVLHVLLDDLNELKQP